jgi:hypothetical protein
MLINARLSLLDVELQNIELDNESQNEAFLEQEEDEEERNTNNTTFSAGQIDDNVRYLIVLTPSVVINPYKILDLV